LEHVEVNERYEGDSLPRSYDFRYGETDLAEGNLRWKWATYLLVGVLAFSVFVCSGGFLLAAMRLVGMFQGGGVETVGVTSTVPPTVEGLFALATNTPRPTVYLPTATIDTRPTRTPTPEPVPTETPGPCLQRVEPGDSLIGLVGRCGHRDLAVISLVLEINNLSAPEVIQVGQTLEIPWPTATPDPASLSTPTEEVAAASGSRPLIAFVPAEGVAAIPILPTETLQPGVTWHQVVSGENIIAIAYRYGANVKILSELNPEVTFSQCDFGEFGGGPSCLVSIYAGQRLRVPAPTPTPTLSPTPSGSETPTPTATATFNAPSALSPGHRALFQRDELVTLRWVASGTLGPEQVYRVSARDITTGEVYETDTMELFLIVPESWQGEDSRRHEYEWLVRVIDRNRPNEPIFATEPRIFVWEGRGRGGE
jgi:LysM repeat protein